MDKRRLLGCWLMDKRRLLVCWFMDALRLVRGRVLGTGSSSSVEAPSKASIMESDNRRVMLDRKQRRLVVVVVFLLREARRDDFRGERGAISALTTPYPSVAPFLVCWLMEDRRDDRRGESGTKSSTTSGAFIIVAVFVMVEIHRHASHANLIVIGASPSAAVIVAISILIVPDQGADTA